MDIYGNFSIFSIAKKVLFTHDIAIPLCHGMAVLKIFIGLTRTFHKTSVLDMYFAVNFL